MLKSRSLKPSKYRAGEWSKRKMKWTRAEDWAAWGKAKAEEKQRSIDNAQEGIEKRRFLCDDREGIDKQGSTDNDLERAEQQGSIDGSRERTDKGSDFQQVSEDASA